jgi:hypothetical protein
VDIAQSMIEPAHSRNKHGDSLPVSRERKGRSQALSRCCLRPRVLQHRPPAHGTRPRGEIHRRIHAGTEALCPSCVPGPASPPRPSPARGRLACCPLIGRRRKPAGRGETGRRDGPSRQGPHNDSLFAWASARPNARARVDLVHLGARPLGAGDEAKPRN